MTDDIPKRNQVEKEDVLATTIETSGAGKEGSIQTTQSANNTARAMKQQIAAVSWVEQNRGSRE